MKLQTRRTFLIGLAFMSISLFWQFYDQVIPYMLEYSFGERMEAIFGAGSRTVVTNTIMSFDNILALFMLPLFGALSDRVSTPLGKRTPFILLGTAGAVTCLVLVGIFEHANAFWPFFIALFLLLFFMGTYRSPAVALMPDLTPKPLRSRANAIINVMGTLGAGVALLAVMLLVKKETLPSGESAPLSDTNYLPLILTVAACMLIPIAVFVFTVREKRLADAMPHEEEEAEEDTGAALPKPMLASLLLILFSVSFWYMAYNGATTALSRYCEEVLGLGLGKSSGFVMVALIVATVSYIPIGALSSRIGRKKMILIGVLLLFAGFFSASFVTAELYAKLPFSLYLIFAVVGIGWAAINVNSFPMVVEISKSGSVGRYTGYYYTFSMAAQVFTPVLSGILIAKLGYESVFPYAAAFTALAFLTMLLVRHGDSIPEKRGVLESLDAGDD